MSNLNLSDINVYAAHTYDRQHILEIDMKINDTLQPIDVSSSNDDLFEEWTVDRDTAFEIGWDLTIVNKLQNLFLKQLNNQRKNEYRFTSIRFPIDEETQELIYFPVYIVDYQYHNRSLQCLINGRTGHVAGLRQFSRLKVKSIESNQIQFCVVLGHGSHFRNYLSCLYYVLCFGCFICLLYICSTFCCDAIFVTFYGINVSFCKYCCFTNRQIYSRLFSSLSRKT